MIDARALRGRDHAVGAALFVAYVGVLVATAPELAMSRDESFYAQAARQYGAWITELTSDPGAALTRQRIDRAWQHNWEHPPLMKIAFAVSVLAHDAFGVFSYESTAFRFPGMLTAGLLLWLVYAWGASVMPRRGALFAALALGSMPRFFYHAHLDCFDVPIAFFATLSAYAYWRTLRDARWGPVLGVVFGLALATKHNSWMLPGIFLVHFLWLRRDQHHADRRPRSSIGWLIWMVTIGPLVLLASWPWLWHATWPRLVGYVRFHLHHVHYTYEYFGVSYHEPPLPWSVPLVMTLFTVSLAVLGLALVGFASRLPELAPPWRLRPGDPVTRRTDLLWLGCLAAPVLAIAWPTTPIFGGTKHWLAAYPFVALFAGRGLVWIAERTAVPFSAARRGSGWVLGALCLLPGFVQTAHSHPFGLSHYMPIAGGVQGAADLGMNRQFWGFTTGSVIPWLADQLPDGGTVWICDTTAGAWSMLHADGALPQNIRAVASMGEANFALVHHEAHFAEVDHQIWSAYGTVQPVHVLRYDGVPIISVYENPERPAARR